MTLMSWCWGEHKSGARLHGGPLPHFARRDSTDYFAEEGLSQQPTKLKKLEPAPSINHLCFAHGKGGGKPRFPGTQGDVNTTTS